MTIEEQIEMRGKINKLTADRNTLQNAWSVIADKIEIARNTGNVGIIAKYLPALEELNKICSEIEDEIDEVSDVYIKAVTA